MWNIFMCFELLCPENKSGWEKTAEETSLIKTKAFP